MTKTAMKTALYRMLEIQLELLELDEELEALSRDELRREYSMLQPILGANRYAEVTITKL